MNKTDTGIKIITSNKKAHFNYFLSEFTECGLVLVGTEIKSLRTHGVSRIVPSKSKISVFIILSF